MVLHLGKQTGAIRMEVFSLKNFLSSRSILQNKWYKQALYEKISLFSPHLIIYIVTDLKSGD